MERYTVFKSTGTHADVITAVGAADVLRNLEPRLVNCGDRFEVRLGIAATGDDFAETDPGFRYLTKAGKGPANLSTEWMFEIQIPVSAPPNTDQISEARVTQGRAIDPELRMYSILSRLSAAAGPNSIVTEFVRIPRETWRQKVWEGFQGRREFVTSSRLVQLFTPHSARGYSLLKPTGTDRNDKSKNQWSEPFVEWLRYRGYFAGCAGWFLDKDIRIFCPVPEDIEYPLYREVASAFRELRLAGSPAKVDCRAVIGLTLILIDRMEVPAPPSSLIGAIFISHYRNMGQANTLMGMEQLAIPAWFDLQTMGDKRRWRTVLTEHDAILKRLSDNKSEEASLLRQYRRIFQPQRALAAEEFVKFLADYGLLLFKRSVESRLSNLLPFSTRNVEAILEQHMTYQEILCNRGFHAIAEALRATTVNALAARRNEVADHRDIRYGVLVEIRRSLSLGKTELLRTVSEFVADFNAETSRRYQNQWRDARISEADVAEFAILLDSAPSAELVGSMLCALSTCSTRGARENAQVEIEQAIPA